MISLNRTRVFQINDLAKIVPQHLSNQRRNFIAIGNTGVHIVIQQSQSN